MNPFLEADRAEEMGALINAVVSSASLTWRGNPEMVVPVLFTNANVLSLIYGGDDAAQGMFAVLYEAGRVLPNILGDNVEPNCETPGCEADHTLEFSFIEAATRGDMDAVVNVCKAAVKEANRTEAHPPAALAVVFASVVALAFSLAMPMRANPEGN